MSIQVEHQLLVSLYQQIINYHVKLVYQDIHYMEQLVHNVVNNLIIVKHVQQMLVIQVLFVHPV